MSGMSDDSDPYLYPGTDVLKNVPDLRDAEQLAAFEALNTAARAYELLQNPIGGGFDLGHLKAIHKHISRTSLHGPGNCARPCWARWSTLGGFQPGSRPPPPRT